MRTITSPITIYDGRVTIRPSSGTVWMTQHQIADLFGVFVSAVGANIRSIFKNEVLHEENVHRERKHRDDSITTFYNLEMITALAFRLKSRQAEQFRHWIVEQAVSPIILWEIPGASEMPN